MNIAFLQSQKHQTTHTCNIKTAVMFLPSGSTNFFYLKEAMQCRNTQNKQNILIVPLIMPNITFQNNVCHVIEL